MTGDHDGAAPAAAPSPPPAVAPVPPPAVAPGPTRHRLRATAVSTVLTRWARAVAEIPRWLWIAAAAIVAIVIVVMLMGGLAQAQPSPSQLGAGDEARTSVYAVTVLDAQFTSEVESEYLEAEPGEKLLVMTMLFENLSDQPIGVGTTADRLKAGIINTDDPLLDLTGIAEIGSASVWRADGSAGQVILQPGVPSEVTIAWTVPEDAFADGVVSLDVHEVEIRRGAVILSSGVVTWRPAELSAQITVDATEAP